MKSTNREILEQAGLIDPGADLTPEQEKAIESLDSTEVGGLISAQKKLGPAFRGLVAPGVMFHGLLE